MKLERAFAAKIDKKLGAAISYTITVSWEGGEENVLMPVLRALTYLIFTLN